MNWKPEACWFLLCFSSLLCTGLQAGTICTGPYKCQYELNITWFKTMTYRDEYLILRQAYFVGNQLQVNVAGKIRNITTKDVIVADGFTRDIVLVNGQFPGPTIEVIEGVELEIKVNNMMTQKSISIHWHGMFQNYTYYSDGAEYITQCPIPPGQSFVYRFWAQPVGTHWYHAHLASMRLDGLFGMLIVHRETPSIPYYPVFVNDWNHITSEDLELGVVDRCENGAVGPPYIIPGIQPGGDCSFEGAELDPTLYQSSLFGGRNRWNNNAVPLAEYVVKAGTRYRFRMVNAGHFFPMQIQIDGHQLIVVATDGADIEPIAVHMLYITAAETIDFEIVPDQPPGRYWMRADTQCPGDYARAILVYDGFQDETADPQTEPRECTEDSPCRVFNCPFGRYPNGANRVCIPIVSARSLLSPEELKYNYGVGSGRSEDEPIELFMNYAMVAGASINGRRFMMPTTPLFQNISAESDCVVPPCLNGCQCQCTTIVTLPYDRTVRLIVSNLQPDPTVTQHMYHAVHLHGHNFAVLAEEFPEYDETTGKIISPNGDITCGSDILCANPSWSGSPPTFSSNTQPVIKDTIVLPVRGYVVLQFKTHNPGYWLFHCHVDVHMEAGMTLVFKFAPDQFPDLPPGFPTCNEFTDNTLTYQNNVIDVNFDDSAMKNVYVYDSTVQNVSVDDNHDTALPTHVDEQKAHRKQILLDVISEIEKSSHESNRGSR